MKSFLKEGLVWLSLLVIFTVPPYFITWTLTSPGKVYVNGGGSSFADTVYSFWCQNYSQSSESSLFFSYSTSSSSQGLSLLQDGKLHFAGADYNFNYSNSVLGVPSVAGAIAIIYNIDTPVNLVLSREAVVGIFNGTIESWDDEQIRITNKGITLPAQKIIPAYRTLPAGATYIFTKALSKFSPEWNQTFGYNTSIQWNFTVNTKIEDNVDMMRYIQYTPNSIGYADYGDVLAEKSNPIATIINTRGEAVAPSESTVERAVVFQYNVPDPWNLDIVDLNCSQCYPICGFTFLFLRTDYSGSCGYQIAELLNFFLWLYNSDVANLSARERGFIMLPEPHVDHAMHMVSGITCNGKTRSQLNYIYFPWKWVAVGSGAVIVLLALIVRLVVLTVNGLKQEDADAKRPLMSSDGDIIVSEDLEKTLIGQDEIQLLEQIGSGGFSSVYVGLWRGTKVAVKRMLCVDEYPQLIQDFMAEATLMSTLRHPKIVQFLAASIKPPHVYIVLELCSKGSVFKVLRDKTTNLTFKQKISFSIDAAEGMHFLHSHKPPIIHRDLKTQNLMVDKNFNVKVGDFGVSRVLDVETAMTYVGSVHICAPEVILNKQYTEKADIYSFGICLWEIMTQKPVYPGMGGYEILEKVANGDLRPPLDDIHPPAMAQLIENCWVKNPKERLSFERILQCLKKMKGQKNTSATDMSTLPQ